jgi:hypothetical protein
MKELTRKSISLSLSLLTTSHSLQEYSRERAAKRNQGKTFYRIFPGFKKKWPHQIVDAVIIDVTTTTEVQLS